MLRQITLQGIKSFDDEQRINTAPLTILTGTNSSGKSSIFQALLLLKQAFETPPSSFAGMYLNGKYASVGFYEDWSSNNRGGPIKIAIEFFRSKYETSQRAKINRRLRLASRNRTARYWWLGTTSRRMEFSPEVELGGTLEVCFSITEKNASSAQLEGLQWSAWSREGEEGALTEERYYWTLSRHKTSLEGKYSVNSPEDLKQFTFISKCHIEHTTREAGAQSPQVDTSPKFETPAAVEGLTIASFLTKTASKACEYTIMHAFNLCIASSINHLTSKLGNEVSSTKKEGRWNPKKHVLSHISNNTNLAATAKFIKGCNAKEFAINIKSYSNLANLLFFWTVRADQLAKQASKTPKKSKASRVTYYSMANLYIDKIAKSISTTPAVINQTEPAEKKADYATLTTALNSITNANPRLRSIIQLIISCYTNIKDREFQEQLITYIVQAETELREDRILYDQNHGSGWPERDAEFRQYWEKEEGQLLPIPTERSISPYFSELLFHLGPLRDEPRNLYTSDPPSEVADIGRRGERVITCLRQFGSQIVLAPAVGMFPPALESRSLLDAVIAWGRYLGIFDKLEVHGKTKYGTVCEVATDPAETCVRADLLNVGVGVSQLLPVVVLCLAVPVGSTLLIEQPELHLHPNIQSRLGEFFAACALTGRQIIVETHSEHLINKIRLLVAQGRLSPAEDIALSYIEKDQFGSEVTNIQILKNGSLSRWPHGFFDEAEKTLAEIMKAASTKEN